MKNLNILLIGLICASFCLISCSDSKKDIKDGARDSLVVPENVVAPISAPVGGAAVAHYTCPNNCEGSGGAAQANCPVCGTAYVHNAAFHNNTPAATTTTDPNSVLPPPATGAASNAAGVFHYTCSAGCAGGAGAAGNCGTCGQALAHNAAFHQ